MRRKLLAVVTFLSLLAVNVSAQGLDTRASKDDWEEINFEYNSSVLVDGFPSLLRLAELLQANPTYKVRLEGHTDGIGSRAFNEKLGMARANVVRDFLVKYGARPNQIETSTRAFDNPRAGRGGTTYRRTDEARWMNRRVALTVQDGQGRTVGAGGAGDAIRALQPAQAAADCCNEVLRRLDKLDTIERMLKDLADQNNGLRNELAGLKQNQDALAKAQEALRQGQDAVRQAQQQAAAQPPPPPPAPAPPPAPKAPSHFQLLGLNVGPTDQGNLSFSGKGRYFAPFGEHFGIQSEGEYYYFRDINLNSRREGQFDIGLVDRIGRFQAGVFSSFKHVNLAGDQTGGTLGQASLTLDYLFKWGRVGAFGSKAFMDDALVNRSNVVTSGGAILANTFQERYLRVVDQAGVNVTAPLFGRNYTEGNFGYLKSRSNGDRFGGTVRLIFPMNDKVAFTVEGGVNETLLTPGNNGRAVVGVQFGNMMRPKEYLAANHAVPVQIPRVRYEVYTRTVRTGNGTPVADAGPSQNLTSAQTATLNGSASFDPDNDPLTFLWTQESGPSVSLSNPNAAITTFAAAAGQTYIFRLTVKDPSGAQSIARTTVTVASPSPTPSLPTITLFTASPSSITSGQSSTLNWQVSNADTVSITALGNVSLNGSTQVSPTQTTTYTLTATKGSQSVTATATVTVNAVTPPPAGPKIVSFTALPATIGAGSSSTLSWDVTGADLVVISEIGSVTSSGSRQVSPAVTTTYQLTAYKDGQSSSATVTVTVTSITSFTAAPTNTNLGGSTLLTCTAANATSIVLDGTTVSGNVATKTVIPGPPATSYTCQALGADGATTQATITVLVNAGP